jgi:6-phosphogluconolactonase (cycloisomerase 2 family)
MSRFALAVRTSFRWIAVFFLALALLSANFGAVFAAGSRPSAVYVQTNQTAGNSIAVFRRAADGSLTLSATVPTGGLGTGSALGSASSVAISQDGRWLFAVNAGSNDISVFRIASRRLVLVDRVASGGQMPVSVSNHKNLVYVLNAGGGGNISGFSVNGTGHLAALAGSTQPLSGAGVAPAQISFSRDGTTLVVTEKATNLIDLYMVGADGIASGPSANASSGTTPYGFAFTQQGTLVVSEAFGGAALASAVSSYGIAGGQLAVISASVATGQTAACWIAVSRNGKFAYSTNAGSATVSAYNVTADGSLSLIDGAAGSTGAGSSPIDAGTSVDGQYLYVLNGATHNVTGFAIQSDGTLQPLGTFEGLPAGSAGIAVW